MVVELIQAATGKKFSGPDNGELHVPVYGNEDIWQQLYDLFVTPRNAIILGMSWGLALIIGKIIPKAWKENYRLHHAPAVMLIVCSTMVWVSGTRPDIKSIGWRISLGIILTVISMVVPVIIMWLAEKYLPERIVKSIQKILL